MRVLHVLDTSPPRISGYSSRARSILEAERERGLDVCAVTGPRQESGAALRDDVGGVRYWRTPRPTAPGADMPGVREALEMAALARRLSDIVGEAPPEVIHAHSPVLAGLPAHAVARRSGAASVYEIRALWEDAAVDQGRTTPGSLRYGAIRAAETWLAKSVDALVVICEGLRRELVARGVDPARVFVAPNGVDPRRFAPMPRDAVLARRLGFGDKPVLGFIGSLFRFEGVPLFLEAMAALVHGGDDVRGLVVGNGEMLETVRRMVGMLGLEGKVVVTGEVAAADVARYYAVCDVLCYPRERRRITELTTPVKPLEALSLGKAVVCSDVGGLRELVREGDTGLFFRAGDVVDLARTLRTLVRDATLRRRLGEAGRRDVLEHRDWRALARRYNQVYDAAIKRARARRQSMASKSPLVAPQSGHVQSSGNASKAVPGATPESGSPSAGS